MHNKLVDARLEGGKLSSEKQAPSTACIFPEEWRMFFSLWCQYFPQNLKKKGCQCMLLLLSSLNVLFERWAITYYHYHYQQRYNCKFGFCKVFVSNGACNDETGLHGTKPN